MTTAPTLAAIIRAVAAESDSKVSEILSARRYKKWTRGRFAVVLIARRWEINTYSHIGRYLGGRDHSTIMNAAGRAHDLMIDDAEFRDLVRGAERRLGVG